MMLLTKLVATRMTRLAAICFHCSINFEQKRESKPLIVLNMHCDHHHCTILLFTLCDDEKSMPGVVLCRRQTKVWMIARTSAVLVATQVLQIGKVLTMIDIKIT